MARATFLGALVIGCVIGMDPAGWSPFGPSKWLVVSTLGFAAGAAMLWRRSAADRLETRTWRLWLAFVALLALAALTGADTLTSLIGHPDRHLGVITWLLFWLLFCAGQLLDTDGRLVVITMATIAAGLMGVYATVELVGREPIDLATTSQRLTGTFGSAALHGAAACLLIPLAVGVWVDAGRPAAIRAAAALCAALATIGLLGSGARAAWLGLVVGVVAAIVARRVHHAESATANRAPAPRSRMLALAGALVVVVAMATWPRIGEVLERDHGAASRLDEWSVAARVIADNPVLGVGPEAYRIAVADGIDDAYERAYGRNDVVPDRAHSAPLDIALAGGIPAALAFLGVVGTVLRRALRLMRDGGPLLCGLAAGVTAYSVQELFLFPLATIDPIWWLCAGMVMTTGRPTASSTERTVGRHARQMSSGLAVVGASVAAVALVAGVLDVAADRHVNRSLTASASDRGAAVAEAERAVELRPDVITYRLIAADAHLRRGTLADVDAAIGHARSALRWSPNDPLALDQLATALLQRAVVTGAPADIDASLLQWRRLVDVDPHRARWQLQLGRAAVLAGDDAVGRAAWQRAIALDPSDTSAAQLLAALDAVG